MNEKNIYKDFNNISIAEHEFDDIDVSMTDLQKSKLKHNLKRTIKPQKFTKTKIAVASAACLVFLISIGYANPSFAAKIPILNPIVEMLGGTGDYAKYSDILNKTVTHNGKSFTINSIVCYDNNIIIGYTAKSNKKIDSTSPLFFPTFKINGKWLNVGFAGGVKNSNKNTAIGTIELKSDDMILPDNFNFDMSFKNLDGTNGKWDFNFNISKAELSKNTKIYKPNQIIKYNNYNFTITQVSLNPLSTEISFSSHSKGKIPWNWIVLDDKGNELSQGSGTCDNNKASTFYSKIDESTKHLTMIPYIEHPEAGIDLDKNNNNIISAQGPNDVAVSINTKLPIDLSEGKNSKVTLTRINFSNNKDTVYIQGIIYGKLPNHQTLCLEGDNPKADIRAFIPTIKKIGNDKYEFTEKYSGLKNDKNYKLIAPNLDYNIDYNSRFTVLLK